MPRLEGEKPGASRIILGLVVLAAVAAALYFAFGRKGDDDSARTDSLTPISQSAPAASNTTDNAVADTNSANTNVANSADANSADSNAISKSATDGNATSNGASNYATSNNASNSAMNGANAGNSAGAGNGKSSNSANASNMATRSKTIVHKDGTKVTYSKTYKKNADGTTTKTGSVTGNAANKSTP